MIDLAQAQQDIQQWMIEFLEVPHPALGGWPPCPYARKARMDKSFDIRAGTGVYEDLLQLSQSGLGGKEVIIFVYDPLQWPRERFARDIELANRGFLLPKDMIALEDHPNDPEIVNGLCMNQGKYAMVLCQGRTDLDNKARAMARRGFYNDWPEQYLEQLFEHRKDPRK